MVQFPVREIVLNFPAHVVLKISRQKKCLLQEDFRQPSFRTGSLHFYRALAVLTPSLFQTLLVCPNPPMVPNWWGCVPSGHLAVSADMFECHNWGRCSWHVEAWRKQVSPNRASDHRVNRVQVEKARSRVCALDLVLLHCHFQMTTILHVGCFPPLLCVQLCRVVLGSQDLWDTVLGKSEQVIDIALTEATLLSAWVCCVEVVVLK